MTDSRGLTYPFIGPTRKQAKEIVWEDHVEHIVRLCDEKGIVYQKNQADLSVRFPGYGKVIIDGSDNIESLRGKSDWGGVVCDEFSSWKNKRYGWEDVIEPNLVVHNAWCIFSGTPKGYEYFHLLMKRGDHEQKIEGDAFDEERKRVVPHKHFRAYRFTSFDNPYLDHAWVDSRKEVLTESVYNQEYLARFEKYTGLVYKDFLREVHVLKPFPIPIGWYLYGAMDFGATNPTVHLWIAVDRDYNIYVYDEYYQRQQQTEFHANLIKAKTQTMPLIATWGDPSAEQEIIDYAGFGIYITPAIKIFDGHESSWVRAGIDRVSRLLKIRPKTGKPKLFIFSNCVNTIREFESYKWIEHKTDETMNEKDMPLKANDHCMDALRYFIVSFFATLPTDDPLVVEQYML